MPNANDLRKTLTDPTPLYFAAGVLDKLREEAPERIAAVRETDPKEIQARFTQQAKETQAKVSETLGGIDTDIKKLREQAQHVALQSLGYAAEYAVKARETYDELAERGREAVQNWRGEEGDEATGATQVTVEREPVKVAEPPVEPAPSASDRATGAKSTRSTKPAQGAKSGAAGNGTKAAGNGAAGNGAKSGTGSEPKSAKSTSSDSSPSPTSSPLSAKKAGTTRKTTNSNGKTPPKTDS